MNLSDVRYRFCKSGHLLKSVSEFIRDFDIFSNMLISMKKKISWNLKIIVHLLSVQMDAILEFN